MRLAIHSSAASGWNKRCSPPCVRKAVLWSSGVSVLCGASSAGVGSGDQRWRVRFCQPDIHSLSDTMESAMWVLTYVHLSEACLAHSPPPIPAQLALLHPPRCHLVMCGSRRRPSCHSHEPWAVIRCREAPPSLGQGGWRRGLSPSGPQGQRSRSCRHQVPLTAVVLQT